MTLQFPAADEPILKTQPHRRHSGRQSHRPFLLFVRSPLDIRRGCTERCAPTQSPRARANILIRHPHRHPLNSLAIAKNFDIISKALFLRTMGIVTVLCNKYAQRRIRKPAFS
jgi:hypothetical protein